MEHALSDSVQEHCLQDPVDQGSGGNKILPSVLARDVPSNDSDSPDHMDNRDTRNSHNNIRRNRRSIDAAG